MPYALDLYGDICQLFFKKKNPGKIKLYPVSSISLEFITSDKVKEKGF